MCFLLLMVCENRDVCSSFVASNFTNGKTTHTTNNRVYYHCLCYSCHRYILCAQAYTTQVDTVSFYYRFECVSICDFSIPFSLSPPAGVPVNVSVRWLDSDLDTCETVRNALHM